MNVPIYDKLCAIAKAQEVTTYGEIAPLAGLDMGNPADRHRITQLLSEISTEEHRIGRPMLTAVVVYRENNMPGPGFFALARNLGLYHGGNDLRFFVGELERVHAFWRGK
jgi:hypothetical protein